MDNQEDKSKEEAAEEELLELIGKMHKQLSANMIDIPPEFAKVAHDNFMEMLWK